MNQVAAPLLATRYVDLSSTLSIASSDESPVHVHHLLCQSSFSCGNHDDGYCSLQELLQPSIQTSTPVLSAALDQMSPPTSVPVSSTAVGQLALPTSILVSSTAVGQSAPPTSSPASVVGQLSPISPLVSTTLTPSSTPLSTCAHENPLVSESSYI